MSALEVGQTIQLQPGEWYGTGALMLKLSGVRRNDAGIWVDGWDQRGLRYSNLLIHPWAERRVEERWRKAQPQLAE